MKWQETCWIPNLVEEVEAEERRRLRRMQAYDYEDRQTAMQDENGIFCKGEVSTSKHRNKRQPKRNVWTCRTRIGIWNKIGRVVELEKKYDLCGTIISCRKEDDHETKYLEVRGSLIALRRFFFFFLFSIIFFFSLYFLVFSLFFFSFFFFLLFFLFFLFLLFFSLHFFF